jgi:hypothetical protein
VSDILVKRNFEPGINRDTIKKMVSEGSGCMQIYQVSWSESFLAQGGNSMICHFDAPDAEALRTVMHTLGAAYESVWSGTQHDSPAAGNGNIMVERQFEEPTTVATMQAIEDQGADCLKTWNVRFIRTYFSQDKKTMLCLYEAPDAESVRQAQTKAGMPFTKVWSYDYVTPENL